MYACPAFDRGSNPLLEVFLIFFHPLSKSRIINDNNPQIDALQTINKKSSNSCTINNNKIQGDNVLLIWLFFA